MSKKSSEKPCNTIDTLIGVSTELKGDINFVGGLRVDGKVKGNINANDESGSSTLVLSEHAQVTGNVSVPPMIINGRIKGSVQCSERIELQSNAEIEGDLHYKVIEMAMGASVNGNLVRDGEKADSGKGNVARLKTVATEAEAE